MSVQLVFVDTEFSDLVTESNAVGRVEVVTLVYCVSLVHASRFKLTSCSS